MKSMYSIMLDGELLPDMHILLFENETVALYSYLLLCIAYARKDLLLYKVGVIQSDGIIVDAGRQFVCDINSLISRYDKVCNKDDVKNVPRDLFNKSLEALETAVKNKFSMEVTEDE